MKTKLSLAIFTAAAALSANAIAGELYSGAESSLNAPVTISAAPSPSEIDRGVAVNGQFHMAAKEALNEAEGTSPSIQAPVTSLAVGGELGAPQGSWIYDGSESNLAE